MLILAAQAPAMHWHDINPTVVALGFFAMMAGLLLRRWLWLVLVPPGASLLVYIILNVIAHRH
jgi:energy-coupling factor transporter transmembrane protein EcfT